MIMRKLIWLSILVMVLAACGSPAPQITSPTATGSAEATVAPTPQATAGPSVDLSGELNALKAGDTATAIAGLEKILTTTPASAETHFLLGQAYYRANQKDKADEQFQAAFTLNPATVPPLDSQDADEWLKFGNAHAALGQFDEAVAAYQTALKIDPNKAAAFTNIGVVYYQQGKFDDAVQQMQKALAIDPGDGETEYMLGATYMQQQKLDEAEQAFNKAIALKPDLAAAYTGLGNVQLARKNLTEAVTALQKATQLQPNQAEAWLALGQAYAAQGNKADASAALTKCQQASQPGPLQSRCQQLFQQLGTP
jgi:cytochrome c-type biogenesis protein CcmH/NrfG